MTLALLIVLDAAALAVAAFVYRALAKRRLRARFRSALADAAGAVVQPSEAPSQTAQRVQATEDAKRRARFRERYAAAAEREGFRRADAEDEADRLYAELTSISVS